MPASHAYKFKNHGIPEWKDYPNCPEYDDAKLGSILHKYRGEFSPKRPDAGDPPSTIIRIWDIEVISKTQRYLLYCFMNGTKPKGKTGYFGRMRRRRLSHFLQLLEGGYITKKRHGRYVLHSDPVAKRQEMKLAFSSSGVSVIPVQKEAPVLQNMPKISDVFAMLKGA